MRFGRKIREKIPFSWMAFGLAVVLLLPAVLVIGLWIKSSMLFEENGVLQVLFHSDWRPLAGKFGFMPFIVSSIWVTLIAIFFAGPVCLFSAINLTFYAHRHISRIMQVVIDILAGIPSVVYGVWGVLVVVPFVSKTIAPFLGVQVSGYSLCHFQTGISLAILGNSYPGPKRWILSW